ncbi:hypothetical protein GCM10010275_36640 [Streptomyces litmocidini]|uniref:hypothetical protein n=1 Tax=Streptomyces litmocidini TaxID=67318 RepID=UPI00198E1555|nr:hypothetical protein [Streptomyces litmocidini]GGU95419.1 hypothetical protein GCM10010275_36640 [Streptomyces litmocidini]
MNEVLLGVDPREQPVPAPVRAADEAVRSRRGRTKPTRPYEEDWRSVLHGIVTDRDIVVKCLAQGKDPTT